MAVVVAILCKKTYSILDQLVYTGMNKKIIDKI